MTTASYFGTYPIARYGAAILCPVCTEVINSPPDLSYETPPPSGIVCCACGEWISPPYCPECGETRCACSTQEKEVAA
jgi:hypothetical protein